MLASYASGQGSVLADGIKHELVSIQILRSAAALGVVALHSSELYPPLPHELIGAFGVDFFFVISGFIMVVASQPPFGRRNGAGTFLFAGWRGSSRYTGFARPC
jgi:peptidoglycan/LPS O-acetylase OafA/YrhL